MKQVILTRHGQSEANREDRFAGRMPFPLTDEGRRQAETLAANLAPLSPAQVLCGPTLRTRQTAEIIGEKLSLPVTADPAFDDISIPHWEGLTKDEIRERFGGEYPTWRATPHLFRLPGCETIAQVRDRAVAGIMALLDSGSHGCVVVVTHLVVVRALLTAAADTGIDRFRDFSLGNGEFAVLENNGRGGVRLVEAPQGGEQKP